MKTALIQLLTSQRNISSPILDAIINQFRPIQLKKSDTFLNEGKVSHEYLILEKGYMRSYVYDTFGNDITLSIHIPMSPVFEVGSFFQRIPSEENIEAITNIEGWTIHFEQLNELFHTYPDFREIGRLLLVKEFVSFKKRTLSLITKTAEERYHALMLSNADVFQHVPLKYIASYLGITDSSLSRIRREYSKK
jgi:CRP-like cAMP-binding protein